MLAELLSWEGWLGVAAVGGLFLIGLVSVEMYYILKVKKNLVEANDHLALAGEQLEKTNTVLVAMGNMMYQLQQSLPGKLAGGVMNLPAKLMKPENMLMAAIANKINPGSMPTFSDFLGNANEQVAAIATQAAANQAEAPQAEA